MPGWVIREAGKYCYLMAALRQTFGELMWLRDWLGLVVDTDDENPHSQRFAAGFYPQLEPHEDLQDLR